MPRIRNIAKELQPRKPLREQQSQPHTAASEGMAKTRAQGTVAAATGAAATAREHDPQGQQPQEEQPHK
jgi:hypothetical protein